MLARMPGLDAVPELVILDFDGVVADSELLSNTMLAEFLTREGLPTTADEAIERYMGRRWEDVAHRISMAMGRPLPDDFRVRYRAVVAGRMRRDVEPVPGIVGLLASNPAQRFCVASSSTIDWLQHCTEKFAMQTALGANLFSATTVARGKPAPDIFLHAARAMDVPPHRCVVIEDSAAGVTGAVAAGMTVVGFLGGAHSRAGHGTVLTAAGAHGLAAGHNEVAAMLGLVNPLS